MEENQWRVQMVIIFGWIILIQGVVQAEDDRFPSPSLLSYDFLPPSSSTNEMNSYLHYLEKLPQKDIYCLMKIASQCKIHPNFKTCIEKSFYTL